jgi:hypothetical protein
MKTGMALVCVGLVLVPAVVNAGGIKGSMFNLPPQKDLVPGNERIGIQVFDPEDNRVIRPLQDSGEEFPASQLRGNLLVVTGPEFSFRLPPRSDGRPGVVTIQFFRSNTAEDIPAEQTQILQNIVVANDDVRRLDIDVVVPRPQDMRRPCPPCYRCGCCWCR